MANNIAKSIINGTYGTNKEKEEEKLPISKQILNGNFTPSSMLPTSNYYTRGSIKMGRSSNKNKALSSLENMLFLTGKGTSQALEGILDTTNYLSSKVNSFGFNLLGRKDLAEKEQKNKQNFIQRNLTNELGDVTGLTNRITENEQAGSVFKRDNLPGQVVQAVGGQIPTLAVGSLSGVGKANTALQASKLTGLTKFGTTALINAPTTTTLATRSFGGALEEAYNNGASESEAVKYAIGSTATEIATEWITGGIPGTSGKGGLDYFADKGIDKISNQLVKDLVKYGYKMVGEGVEEGIAEIITPYLKNATYSSGEKVNWNDVINSTIVGGLSAGIIEAPMTVSNIRNDVRNIKTQNLANQNSKSVNKTVNEIVQQEQKTNSATMPNAKIPRLMPKTNSGTSSLYINDSTNLNNGQIIPLTKNLQNVENNNANMNTLNNNMEVNNIFSNQVDEVLKGTFDKNNHMTVLEHTPEVLQKLGIQDYPITLTASKLDRIMNESGSQKGEYHNLGVDTVKKLPHALQNPLDIVKSHNNSYVLTTDLSDNQNRQVIASIKIDGKGYINNIEIDTNVMTSAYGRNNYDSWMKRHQDKGEIVYDVDRGYIDTKKLDTIPRLQLSNNNIKYSKSDVNDRVQFPMRDSSSSNSTSDIIKNISPISYNNDSIKSDKSQILMPSTNINMQNNENNTNNRLIPQDPTKESTYDDAKMLKSKINNDVKKGIIETKINKMLQSTSYKAVNKAAKTGQSYLTFNNNAKRHFKERLMSFVGKTKDEIIGTNSWNDIKNLVKEYSNKDLVYVDEELKSVKSGIRKTKIKINDDLKNQITDYNEFRKDNFGKLNLSNEGIDIDSYYQELSEQYPQYFGSSTTSADMLYELSDFMNKDINIVEKFQFDDAYIEQTTAKIYNTLIQGTLNEQEINDIRNSLEDKMNARTRERVQAELLAEMGINESDISQGNDISSINLSRTDPIRVNEKVFGTKIGEKINNATIRKTQQNEAERIRFLNKERNEISKLGIKAFSKESAAVQKYGEKQYINEKGDVVLYGDNELASEFPNIKTQEKIKSAARVIRQKYDIYIDQINNVLVDMGYQPIKKRNDYMRHFQALNDVFSKYGIPLNPESLQSDSLPTDINGLTDQFKPGKQYFANAMQRMGLKTEYDAITGIDGYLEGASNLIYHTEDIQRYRTLSKFIRNTYGAEHGFEDFAKMNLEQQEQRLKDIQLNKLAKYVSWLDEQANALANKKGKIDRGFEELFGRKVYTILQTAKNQVGSNMVGFNVRSALTNFASVVQGASKTNKIAFVKGTISAVNNIINNDGLVYKSDFLTRRFGSDRLSQKLWQKATNAGFSLMTGTDYFTANQIWRSKYYEYLDKGMTESEAIRGADDFSARIMGDRSKGSTATIFNSKTLGFFTQFQLEVNNQWSSLIHDNKIDIEKGNKTASSVIFELGQLFAFSYLFNNLMKSLTGSDVMIDPIELLQIILGDDDDDDDLEERATKVLGEIVNNLPFASIFTGGRIPIGEAFKGIETGFKYATGQTDKYGNNYELEDVSNDMIESAFYWILPTGYSQLNKTVKGLSMYDKKLPIKGSYTEGGNLRFTADESLSGKIKSALFGQYSSKEAQDYIDSNFQTIPKGKIAEMKELGMNSSEYRNYRKGLSNAGKTNEEKLNYINSLKLPIETKNIMANNIVNSDKYKINMGEYNNFDSYEEMKYSYENPIKYSTIKQITTYKKYNTYKEEIERVKDNYENSTQRKYAVINYVNDLNLSIPQKAMLIKMNYSSFTDYDSTIINYINSQDLTIQEKTDILTELGFTVRDGRVYSK